MKRKKVIRILVIEGEADWVDTTLQTSQVQLDRPFNLRSCIITEVLREEMQTQEKKERIKYYGDQGGVSK